MKYRLRWFWCWCCYQTTMILPLHRLPLRYFDWLIASCGEYAYSESYAEWKEHRIAVGREG